MSLQSEFYQIFGTNIDLNQLNRDQLSDICNYIHFREDKPNSVKFRINNIIEGFSFISEHTGKCWVNLLTTEYLLIEEEYHELSEQLKLEISPFIEEEGINEERIPLLIEEEGMIN